MIKSDEIREQKIEISILTRIDKSPKDTKRLLKFEYDYLELLIEQGRYL